MKKSQLSQELILISDDLDDLSTRMFDTAENLRSEKELFLDAELLAMYGKYLYLINEKLCDCIKNTSELEKQ